MQLRTLLKLILQVKASHRRAHFDESGNLIVQGRQPKRKRKRCRCPVCGRKARFYDKGRGK